MLTPRQSFKIAFLRRCANAGLNMEETHVLVKEALTREKQAAPAVGSLGMNEALRQNVPLYGMTTDTVAGAARGLAQGLVQPTINLGLTAGIGIPAVLGGLGGLGVAGLQNLHETSPEELRDEEKIEEYRRAAEQARLRRKLRLQREQRRSSRPLI